MIYYPLYSSQKTMIYRGNMRIYSAILATILSTLSIPVMAAGITIQELPTTDKEGDFPVCFNGSGELLPCDSGVVLPPPGSRIGSWSGRILYDRGYTGDDTCYDGNTTLMIIDGESWGDEALGALTIIRDAGGGLGINTGYGGYTTPSSRSVLSDSGYVATYCRNLFSHTFDFTLQFNSQGYAEGVWTESSTDCFGTWSFTKD